MINSQSLDFKPLPSKTSEEYFKILTRHSENSLAMTVCLNELKNNPGDLNWLSNILKVLPQVSPETGSIATLAILRELVEKQPNFESYSQLGHYHYHQQCFDLAFDFYEKAISELVYNQNDLFEIYKNMGNICVHDRDFEAAEDFYHKAWTLFPESDLLQVNLGTLAIQKNDLNYALEKFRRAIELNGKNDKAWVGLALSHSEMGDFQLALANLENALDLNPLNRTAVLLAAQWCQRENRVAWGISVLEEFLSSVESDPDLSLVLVRLFCFQNEFELAKIEIERILLWDPTNETALKLESEIKL